MVSFFIRTQQAHEWRSPPYKFTVRQGRAFRRMIREADSKVQDEREHEEEGVGMNRLQRACLDFYIELLNTKITFNEYNSTLVCTLAVLGVREDGWLGPELYPSILSAMVKCARFMVVQKAVHMADNQEDDSGVYSSEPALMAMHEDSGYDSESSDDATGTNDEEGGFTWGEDSIGRHSSPVRSPGISTVTRNRLQGTHQKKGCLD